MCNLDSFFLPGSAVMRTLKKNPRRNGACTETRDQMSDLMGITLNLATPPLPVEFFIFFAASCLVCRSNSLVSMLVTFMRMDWHAYHVLESRPQPQDCLQELLHRLQELVAKLFASVHSIQDRLDNNAGFISTTYPFPTCPIPLYPAISLRMLVCTVSVHDT